MVTVQVFGPAAVTGVLVQLSDHPPKTAPAGAVNVTVVPMG
jgi:hypothetical protein